MTTEQTNRVIVQPSIRDGDRAPFAIEEFPNATYKVHHEGGLVVAGPTRTAHFPGGSFAFVTQEIVREPNAHEELLRRAGAAMRELAGSQRNRGYGPALECLLLANDIESLVGA